MKLLAIGLALLSGFAVFAKTRLGDFGHSDITYIGKVVYKKRKDGSLESYFFTDEVPYVRKSWLCDMLIVNISNETRMLWSIKPIHLNR